MDYKVNDNLNFADSIHNKAPILDAKELYYFFDYMWQRFYIQVKRERGEPFPWTDNEILRDNSFTCNRRIDDKTTKWLLENITYNDNLEFNEKFWKTLIFRTYNKIETAQLINLPRASFNELESVYSFELDKLDGDPFTRAYKNIAVKYTDREKYEPQHSWKSVALLRILNLAQHHYYYSSLIDYTAETVFGWLKDNLAGVGDFLGYQLLLDLSYIPEEVPFSNNCFVITGPGSQTGIDRIFLNKDGMTYEECVIYLSENFETLCRQNYEETFDYAMIKDILNDPQAYCVSDVQNLLCEFSKYRYLMEGRHLRPRKYEYKGDN